MDIPKIISIDDHVIEPADVWQNRLPAKYRDVGPRVIQERGKMQFVGGVFSYEPSDEGELCDWWLYEDKRVPQTRLSAAAGFSREEVKVTGITYEEMRDGCYDPVARLADMDMNHTEAQMCFPSFPRFCGQTFMEAEDKVLSDLCVKAYNDWMVEDWCGGTEGRLIPNIIIQLWDAELAARDEAIGKFLTFFYDPENYVGWVSMEGFLPAVNSAVEALVASDPSFEAWLNVLGSCKFYPSAKTEWADVKQGVIAAEQAALTGADVQTELDKLQTQIAGK